MRLLTNVSPWPRDGDGNCINAEYDKGDYVPSKSTYIYLYVNTFAAGFLRGLSVDPSFRKVPSFSFLIPRGIVKISHLSGD